MITDYRIIKITHPVIDSVVFWDQRIWLNLKQLQLLFRVNKAKLERMISKLAQQMNLYSHYEAFSAVRIRKHDGKDFEYIYQVRYYDEQVIQALQKLNNCSEIDGLFLIMKQMETEARFENSFQSGSVK